MNPLLTTAITLALKAAVGIGVVFALWRLSRRAPAQVRHALLASALLSALLMPVLAVLTPVIPVPVLPVMMPSPLIAAMGADAATPVGAALGNPSGTMLIVSLYLAGVVAILLSQVNSFLRLRALKLRLAKPALRARFDLYRDAFPGHRRVRLREGPGVGTPMTWGFFRPVLVMPSCAARWSDQRIDEALIHELAHIRRGDWLVQRLAAVCCAVYWFLPPVWYMAGHLRMEAEHACDDVVVSRFGSRADYATHLVELARSQYPGMHFPAVAMATASPLGQRIQAILDSEKRRHAMHPRTLCAVFSLPLGLFVALAAIQVTAAEAPAPLADVSSVRDVNGVPGMNSGPGPSPVLASVPAVMLAASAAPAVASAPGATPGVAPVLAPAADPTPAAPAARAVASAPEATPVVASGDVAAPEAVLAPAADTAPAAPVAPVVPVAPAVPEAPAAPAAAAPPAASEGAVAPEVARRDFQEQRERQQAQRELARAERELLDVARDAAGAQRDMEREQRREYAQAREFAGFDGQRAQQRAMHAAQREVARAEREAARSLRAEQRELTEQEQELRRAGSRTRRSVESDDELPVD